LQYCNFFYNFKKVIIFFALNIGAFFLFFLNSGGFLSG
jgi:hypothetical protein